MKFLPWLLTVMLTTCSPGGAAAMWEWRFRHKRVKSTNVRLMEWNSNKIPTAPTRLVWFHRVLECDCFPSNDVKMSIAQPAAQRKRAHGSMRVLRDGTSERIFYNGSLSGFLMGPKPSATNSWWAMRRAGRRHYAMVSAGRGCQVPAASPHASSE